MRQKFLQVIRDETLALQPFLMLANMLAGPLPYFVGNRLRVYMLRQAGFRIGQGTVMWGMPTITGIGKITERLTIGEHCVFNHGSVLDLEDTITIGDHVSFGHQVLLMTSSHQIGPAKKRAGPLTRAPIIIGDGAWLGSRCIVLPGVTIGAGAVVGAGTVVVKDVPENTLVTGVTVQRGSVQLR